MRNRRGKFVELDFDAGTGSNPRANRLGQFDLPQNHCVFAKKLSLDARTKHRRALALGTTTMDFSNGVDRGSRRQLP